MNKIYYFFTALILILFGLFWYFHQSTPAILSPVSVNLKNIPRLTTSNPKPTVTPTPTVKIGLMGDLGLGRTVTSIARKKNNFEWSFSGVSFWLRQNDFNLANLESPIIDRCPEGKPGTFIFCGDPKFVPLLNQNKFVLNLANNHILNYGDKGLLETEKLLSQNGIDYVYSHRSDSEFTQKTVNGIQFGFLGFDLTNSQQVDKNNITALVKKYDPQVDWLMVSLHWGNEYLSKPENWRIDFAHSLIDNGADIIAGHHPHVVQTKEIYQNKIIYYSLGNFIFDQNWSIETSKSIMARLTLSKDGIINSEEIPIIIKANSRPEIVN